MNLIKLTTTFGAMMIALVAIVCLSQLVEAGGDKSARTTVITLTGGGEKAGGTNYVPIPIPVCQQGYHGRSGGHSYGGGHGAW